MKREIWETYRHFDKGTQPVKHRHIVVAMWKLDDLCKTAIRPTSSEIRVQEHEQP